MINRYVVSDDEFNKTYLLAKKQKVQMVVGASSFFVRRWNSKIVKKSSCRQIDGEYYLAGEYARKILKEEIGDVMLPRNHHLKMKLSAPRLYLGQYSDMGAYFDLTSAFYQIYKRLWADMSYPRGEGTIPLDRVAERLHFWKAARNAVVGIMISERVMVQVDNNVHLQYTRGALRNWAVWHTIQTILHNIAEFMHYRLGAFYVATDGYIIPHTRANDAKAFLDAYGFQYHHTIGLVDISRWGGYRIIEYGTGNEYKKTLTFGVKAKRRQRPFRNIERCERKTLDWWSKL